MGRDGRGLGEGESFCFIILVMGNPLKTLSPHPGAGLRLGIGEYLLSLASWGLNTG